PRRRHPGDAAQPPRSSRGRPRRRTADQRPARPDRGGTVMTPAGTAHILTAARAWLAQDPDPETREELDILIRDAEGGSEPALDELHSRFDTRLEFGTAGLRGRIEAGSARMNRVLVGQAAAGIAAYLAEREPDTRPSVVIG